MKILIPQVRYRVETLATRMRKVALPGHEEGLPSSLLGRHKETL